MILRSYRLAVAAAIGLALILGACAGPGAPRVLQHGPPAPGDSLPHLLCEIRVRGDDVRLGVCAEAGVLVLYWRETEGRLAVFTLDGSTIGRNTVPGTFHAAGFRCAPAAVEILYQNREGRVVILGFSGGKRVGALFEEPYPWAELTELTEEPPACTASDHEWRYRVDLEVTPGGGVLRVTITGSR